MTDTETVTIPQQHPAFSGHFPGAPVLPGVVLLDQMLQMLARPEAGWTIATAKFLHPVRPGETLSFEHQPLANGGVRFVIRSGERAVASGMLVPGTAAHETNHVDQAR
jgi:3-hydroxymyristoyl/3-hydroxydecanoyl-(acyl carrier protein) dehydratase